MTLRGRFPVNDIRTIAVSRCTNTRIAAVLSPVSDFLSMHQFQDDISRKVTIRPLKIEGGGPLVDRPALVLPDGHTNRPELVEGVALNTGVKTQGGGEFTYVMAPPVVEGSPGVTNK